MGRLSRGEIVGRSSARSTVRSAAGILSKHGGRQTPCAARVPVRSNAELDFIVPVLFVEVVAVQSRGPKWSHRHANLVVNHEVRHPGAVNKNDPFDGPCEVFCLRGEG